MSVVNDWDKREIAEAQYYLVRDELNSNTLVTPYKSFIETVDAIKKVYGDIDNLTVADIGCGVGHYGILIQRYFPTLRYCGFDFSPHMIEFANKLYPDGQFAVSDYKDVDVSQYDILLCSSLLEVIEDWKSAIGYLCSGNRDKQIVILHRMRITTNEPTTMTAHRCYFDGLFTPRIVFNRHELVSCMGQYTTRVLEHFYQMAEGRDTLLGTYVLFL